MSAFICSSKHFNSIENKLKEIRLPYSMKKDFPELTSDKFSTEEKHLRLHQIINTLRDINVLCVCLQYKHHYEGKLDKEIQIQKKRIVNKKAGYKNLSLLGLHNALRCLNYQIEIGHLKELRELTKEEDLAIKYLEAMINETALEIVSELPEDQTNMWRID